MVDNLNMQARISADVADFIRDLDRVIDKAQAASKSLRNMGVDVEKLDRNLNKARTQVTGATRDTNEQARAAGAAATAVAGHSRATRDLEGNLIRARYALYDVATSYAAVSAATLGAVAATSLLAVKYETAFTEIERTTLDSAGNVSANVDALREQFLDLSEVIPLSFQELTKIGSLGAQLGIAEADLVSFTTTVAQFSKLSGVSAEQTALAFGRIGELLNVSASEYVNLGSAIAANAVSAAATEAQIISLTRELSAGAAGAGFTADQVVGLSSALASLGVAPERARGALSTYFGTLNRAVAEGGQSLQDFAAITGLTTAELERLVRSGEGGEVLQRFIAGLNGLDNVTATRALDRLGLAQLRVEDTFRRLGQNVQFVSEQFQIAEKAYTEGTFLGDAYSVVLDDVASQFQLLLNSIQRFVASAGLPLLEFLRVALPVAADFFSVLSSFAESEIGRVFFGATAGIAVFIGAIAAIRATAALATASVFAIATASKLLGGTGVIASINAMRGALIGANASALTLKTTLIAISKTIAGLAIAAATLDQLFNGGEGLSSIVGEDIGRVVNDLFNALNTGAITLAIINKDFEKLYDILASIIRIMGGLADNLGNVLGFVQNSLTSVIDAGEGLREFSSIFGGISDAITGAMQPLIDMIAYVRILISEGTRASFIARAGQNRLSASRGVGPRRVPGASEFDGVVGAFEDIEDAAGGAGRQVRTLVDYANDLRSVFGRAFDIRFKAQLAVDDVSDSWDTLAERIRNARIEIQQLTAERGIKEYFLSVAEAYGDELRAGVLRGEIAELNERIADTQADASTELQGNSQAARQNRQVITGLLSNYQDYITALAEGGADQATLNAAVARSRQEFLAQAQALGFSEAQLRPYLATFTDLSTVIANVPRNITVAANINPALQALNEFVAAARGAGSSAGSALADGIKGSLGSAQSTGASFGQLFRKGFMTAINGAKIYTDGSIEFGPNRGALTLRAFAGGGYTGRGGKYEPAGIVHRGEYVVPKQGVDQSTGLPKPSYMNSLGAQMPSSRGGSYASGGPVTGGSIMVSLSPEDRALMRQVGAMGDIRLMVDSREIARASAKGGKQIIAEGGTL